MKTERTFLKFYYPFLKKHEKLFPVNYRFAQLYAGYTEDQLIKENFKEEIERKFFVEDLHIPKILSHPDMFKPISKCLLIILDNDEVE